MAWQAFQWLVDGASRVCRPVVATAWSGPGSACPRACRLAQCCARAGSFNSFNSALLQGMRVRPDGPQLISEMIRKELGLDCRWVELRT